MEYNNERPHESLNNLTPEEYQLMAEKPELSKVRGTKTGMLTSTAHHQQLPILTDVDQCWSIDFVSENQFHGRRFRALTVVDNFSRECLEIHAGKSLKSEDVVGVMERLRVLGKRLPVRIQKVYGSEFISKSLDKWAYEHGVTMDLSSPGKPTDNPIIESFNGSLQDECSNIHWFLSLEDPQDKLDNWRREYNHERADSSWNDMTPAECIRSLWERRRFLI